MSATADAWLRAADLPARWRGRDRFVILDAAFGRGERFLAIWQAWRDDPARCDRLHVIAMHVDAVQADPAGVQTAAPVATAPVAPSAYARPQAPDIDALADRLAAAWPPRTRNLHRLSFDGGRLVLLLVPGTVREGLRSLRATVDVFFEGEPSPAGCRGEPLGRDAAEGRRARAAVDASQPRGDAPAPAPGSRPGAGEALHRARARARLAAPEALWVGPAPDAFEHRAWVSAGFVWEPGTPASTALRRARWAPAFLPRGPAARRSAWSTDERHVVIVGAGLAGCATAWALAEQGWRCTLLDAGERVAGAASGNAAGLFHGIVNGQDGSHARLHRVAAVQARDAVATALQRHGVAGSTAGLLQLVGAASRVADMRALLMRLRLPPDYVEALDAHTASARAGVPLASDAWFYPGGGWVDPAGLARSFLERAGSAVAFRGGCRVARLEAAQGAWHLVDAQGARFAAAGTVVFANAMDAARLAGVDWPLASVRGQISCWPHAGAAGLATPRLPLTGAGYVLPLIDDALMFGATSTPGDADPTVRRRDHEDNLRQLARLLPAAADAAAGIMSRLTGRTAWRCSSPDRLPLIGAVPSSMAADAGSPAGLASVPRAPGLFVFTALGARGITWAAFGAQVLAARITGAPLPLEAGLLDSVDPARFRVRGPEPAAPAT